MPIGPALPAAIMPPPKRNAVLLNGPPMSNAIIAPMTAPNAMVDAPSIPDSQWVSRPNRDDSGAPMRRTKASPTTSVVTIGMTMMGQIGWMYLCTGIFLIASAT